MASCVEKFLLRAWINNLAPRVPRPAAVLCFCCWFSSFSLSSSLRHFVRYTEKGGLTPSCPSRWTHALVFAAPCSRRSDRPSQTIIRGRPEMEATTKPPPHVHSFLQYIHKRKCGRGVPRNFTCVAGKSNTKAAFLPTHVHVPRRKGGKMRQKQKKRSGSVHIAFANGGGEWAVNAPDGGTSLAVLHGTLDKMATEVLWSLEESLGWRTSVPRHGTAKIFFCVSKMRHVARFFLHRVANEESSHHASAHFQTK